MDDQNVQNGFVAPMASPMAASSTQGGTQQPTGLGFAPVLGVDQPFQPATETQPSQQSVQQQTTQQGDQAQQQTPSSTGAQSILDTIGSFYKTQGDASTKRRQALMQNFQQQQQQQAQQDQMQDMIDNSNGGGLDDASVQDLSDQTTMPQVMIPQGTDAGTQLGAFKAALAKQESGGNYAALGTPSKNGDRAMGKYQVMASNVPSWTKAALGVSMSPQQFLNNPQAQEQVFDYKMKTYYQKYGNWADVAAVWFSGRPVSGNSSADVNGKTVPSYVRDVMMRFQGNLAQGSQQQPSGQGGPGPETPLQATGAPTTGLSQQYPNLSQTQGLGVVTTPFGGQTRWEGAHPGVDIANKKGTPIPAFTDGTVIEAETGKGQANPNSVTDPNKGFGNHVTVQDAQGNHHYYSHLGDTFVKAGQHVERGQTIAPMGNSGSTYSNSGGDGAHLDYRIQNAAGKYLNPMYFIGNKVK